MSHAKRVTRDNRKNPEYHVVAAIRQLWTDTNYPTGKSCSFLTWFGHDFLAGQFVSVLSYLIAATT